MTGHSLDFQNEELQPDDLPHVAEVDYHLLKPSYRPCAMLSMALWMAGFSFFVLIALFVTGVLNSLPRLGILLGILALLFTSSLLLRYFGYKMKGFAIRRHDVLYRTGIWWKRKVYIPKKRIQHVEIKKTPLEDLFGLSRLLIFTAGGSGSDLVIPGLDPEMAEGLKLDLMDHLAHVDEEE